MKKNKGFTLVELLAVVAILSLLVIIALPNIIELFNEAKERSFITECKQIYTTAQQKWMTDSMFETDEMKYARSNQQNCNNKLDLSGRNEINYFVKINKSGSVSEFFATDGTYQFQYFGGNLQITDIEGVEKLAEITNDSGKINIGCEEVTGGRPRPMEVCTVPTNLTLTKTMITLHKGITLSESGQDFKLRIPVGYFDCLETKGSITYNNVSTCLSANPPQTLSPTSVLLPSNEFCYSFSMLSFPPTGGGHGPCLDADCEIYVYDKKKKKKIKKKLRDITYDDLVLAWDFDLGKEVWVKPLWIQKIMVDSCYYLLTFDDGTTLKVVGDHRIYSDDDKMFVSAKKLPIGFTTINANNKRVKLISREEIEEEIEYCNIITDHHINVYANGILTSHGINNLYRIENMKFVKENNPVFDRSELSEIDDELYNGLRLNETSSLYEGTKEQTKESLLNYINMLKMNRK